MGKKQKYSQEQKIQACTDYLSGTKSAIQIARELKMSKYGQRKVLKWVQQYRYFGASAFEHKNNNKQYSKEFKMRVIKEYNSGLNSLEGLALKYGIPSDETVRQWILKYNNHIEIKDYDPHPEVYMAETKKTTIEERIEIVKWCLDHDRSFKDAAAHFGCSYMQVRDWVKKYEKNGEEGLSDKRGRRKAEEELTELEKAQRRIKQLERENEEMRKANILLKKVMDAERW